MIVHLSFRVRVWNFLFLRNNNAKKGYCGTVFYQLKKLEQKVEK